MGLLMRDRAGARKSTIDRLRGLLEEGTRTRLHYFLIDTDVILGHSASSEAPLEACTHLAPVDCLYSTNGTQRFVVRIDHNASDTLLDQLGYRTAAEPNNRRAASHGFYHDEPKRLRPGDREQQCSGFTQKVALLPLVDFADVLDRLAVDQWLYPGFEMRLIDFVDLCSDL